MSCGRVFEEYMNMNNAPSNEERRMGQNRLVAIVVSVVMFALINFLVGPYLWNEVLRKLFPACQKADWYDTVLLSVLLSLILPVN